MADPTIRNLADPNDPVHLRREPPPLRTVPPPQYVPQPRAPVREDLAVTHKSIEALVKEVRELRAKSDNDDALIETIERQRADARRELEGLRRKHAIEMENQRINYEDQISSLKGGAEVAEQKVQSVNATLQDVVRLVLQAGRVMAGQETPPRQEAEAETTHPLLQNTID